MDASTGHSAPIQFVITPGGSRLWLQHEFPIDLFVQVALDNLCKWGGPDKSSATYISWEIADEYIPAARRILGKHGYQELLGTSSPDWLS